uniref:Uncharacterized protein n=1 Tax=Salix viminalis TaxID=40686 RepID=A0A6N2M1Q4_SALVM
MHWSSSLMMSMGVILKATRLLRRWPMLTNGNGSSVCYCVVKQTKRLFLEIEKTGGTMSSYRILLEEWDFIVNCMEKWWLQARFLYLTTGLIWMISGHKGRWLSH